MMESTTTESPSILIMVINLSAIDLTLVNPSVAGLTGLDEPVDYAARIKNTTNERQRFTIDYEQVISLDRKASK